MLNLAVQLSGSTYLTSGGSGGALPIVTFVSGGTRMANTFNGSSFYGMARTVHQNLSGGTITAIKFGLPNFYVAFNGENKGTPVAGSCTYKAWVEYPIGTYTPVTYTGVATGTAVANSFIECDFTTVSIPDNAIYAIKFYGNWPNGVCFTDHQIFGGSGNPADTTHGVWWNIGSGDDNPANGFVSGFAPYQIYPTHIVALTTKDSFAGCGDSIFNGANDYFDGTSYAVGHLERWAELQGIACANFARFGEQVTHTIAAGAYTNRAAIINAYAKHIISDYGINDITNSVNAATIQANLATFWNKFTIPGVKVQALISSVTTSLDNWKTKAMQIFNAPQFAVGTGVRDIVNGSIVAKTIGADNYVDFQGSFIDTDNKFKVDNVTDFLNTNDGTHPTHTASVAAASAGPDPNTLFN